jgi:hypothetical protein
MKQTLQQNGMGFAPSSISVAHCHNPNRELQSSHNFILEARASYGSQSRNGNVKDVKDVSALPGKPLDKSIYYACVRLAASIVPMKTLPSQRLPLMFR